MSKTKALRRLKRREVELRDRIVHLEADLLAAKRVASLGEHYRQSLKTMMNILVEDLPEDDLLRSVDSVRGIRVNGEARSLNAPTPLKGSRSFLVNGLMSRVECGDLALSAMIMRPLLASYLDRPPARVWRVQFDNNVACYSMNDDAFSRLPEDVLVRMVSEQIAGLMKKNATQASKRERG